MTELTRRGLSGLSLAAAATPAIAAPAQASRPAFGPVAPLNITENPYGPGPKGLAAIRAAAEDSQHYPYGPEVWLMKRIAEVNGVAPEQVVICNGALELLAMAALLIARDGAMLLPALTYDTHAKYAARHGGLAKRARMAADLQVDFDALAAGLSPEVKLVYVCNPNNPTGLLADRRALRAFCIRASKQAPVLVDEAFIDMCPDPEGETVVDLVRDGHDVTVVGTFSKAYGLAGLPTGYAIATPARAKALRDLLIASHVGAGLTAALALYRDRAHLDVANRAVAQGRAVIEDACHAVGWRTLPSVGSFVFAEIGPRAVPVIETLAKQGVMLRQFGTDHPTWARIAVREAPALAAFVKALPAAARA